MSADALGLLAALAAGLVIGLQRGWQAREVSDGGRVAGMRTFGLLGLLGAILGLLGGWMLAAGTLGLAIFNTVTYRAAVAATGNLSATSAIAQMLTFGLGALAAHGSPMLALSAAVMAAVLLDLRTTLHGWLQIVERKELSAGLQVLVLSVVVLPMLPDKAFGPYGALNPYRLWWAVVLVAGLSLSGHIAMRVVGPQRGALWTGLLGGLASSTAATLALARQARAQPGLRVAALAGIWCASAIMFVRIAVLLLMLAPSLGRLILMPVLVSAASLLAIGLLAWRRRPEAQGEPPASLKVFDLGTALVFGAVLGLMSVLTQASREWLGVTGLHALALLSGTVDVDAITVSVAQMQASSQVPTAAAATTVACAVLSNMAAKATISSAGGHWGLGRQVAAGYLLSMTLGAAALYAAIQGI